MMLIMLGASSGRMDDQDDQKKASREEGASGDSAVAQVEKS